MEILCVWWPQFPSKAIPPPRVCKWIFLFTRKRKTQTQESRQCAQHSWDPGWPARSEFNHPAQVSFSCLRQVTIYWRAQLKGWAHCIVGRKSLHNRLPVIYIGPWDISPSTKWVVSFEFSGQEVARHLWHCFGTHDFLWEEGSPLGEVISRDNNKRPYTVAVYQVHRELRLCEDLHKLKFFTAAPRNCVKLSFVDCLNSAENPMGSPIYPLLLRNSK